MKTIASPFFLGKMGNIGFVGLSPHRSDRRCDRLLLRSIRYSLKPQTVASAIHKDVLLNHPNTQPLYVSDFSPM